MRTALFSRDAGGAVDVGGTEGGWRNGAGGGDGGRGNCCRDLLYERSMNKNGKK